jgi:uncharacterized protein YkwD
MAAMTLACTPPSGSPPSTADATPTWDVALLDRINAERAAVGAGPLAACATLRWAAQVHSLDQAEHSKLTHDGTDGSDLRIRVERAGYVGWSNLGENVAAGYPTVDAVMNGWMSSTLHRENLLNAAFTHVGVGQAASSGGTLYWTQDFGRSGRC